jgi:hypothetical protein
MLVLDRQNRNNLGTGWKVHLYLCTCIYYVNVPSPGSPRHFLRQSRNARAQHQLCMNGKCHQLWRERYESIQIYHHYAADEAASVLK